MPLNGFHCDLKNSYCNFPINPPVVQFTFEHIMDILHMYEDTIRDTLDTFFPFFVTIHMDEYNGLKETLAYRQ